MSKKVTYEFEITSSQAFKILCETLDMDFVLDENSDFFVKKNEYGENVVYIIKNEKEEVYDDRGDLFIALRNTAVNIFPNVGFRNAHYIYKNNLTNY